VGGGRFVFAANVACVCVCVCVCVEETRQSGVVSFEMLIAVDNEDSEELN